MYARVTSLPLSRIVSGGQTGADRAALDFAIKHGIPHGGWCPLGRWAEDGCIPARYNLIETPSSDPAVRTEWNVRDSDGTIIFSIQHNLTGGSLWTAECAVRYGRPLLHLHVGLGWEEILRQMHRFIFKNSIKSLNVAGPRISNEPQIYHFVSFCLERWWESILAFSKGM
jgi:hypothetical protein